MYFICRMATGESDVTSLTAAATDPVVLKRNSDDVGWEYEVLVDPLNKESEQDFEDDENFMVEE
jgi:hypothetical protein